MDGLNEGIIGSREHREAIGVITSKAEIGMLGTGIGHMSEIGSGMVVVLWLWSASSLLVDGLVNKRDVEQEE
jgi:hypothetical protein